MSNSVLLTDSGVNKRSGGGVVSYNLMESLISTTTLQYILSSQKFNENKIGSIPVHTINPHDWGYGEPQWKTSPFLLDYLAFHMLDNIQTDVAVSYGCPFALALEELKRNFGTKIICDLAPHNIDISREEHMKFTKSYPYPHLTGNYMWGIYSRHLRLADKVVVHSKKSAEYIMGKARLKEMPIVIPHGCYLSETTETLPENFTPGYFGAMGYDKGMPYLLTAWVNHPLRDKTKFLVGGAGSNFNIKQGMEYFEIVGHVNNANDFYNRCSIGVFPTITEGFNICALEMMAAGRPIIIGEGAGISELIEDGKQGFVINGRDIEKIQNKIQWFYDNPDQVRSMGENARKLAEKYTWTSIQNAYKRTIQEVL